MTERQKIIFSAIPKSDVFADVGCDHGYIAKSMIVNNKSLEKDALWNKNDSQKTMIPSSAKTVASKSSPLDTAPEITVLVVSALCTLT